MKLSFFNALCASLLAASAAQAQSAHDTMSHEGHRESRTMSGPEATGENECAMPMGAGVIDALDVKNATAKLTLDPIDMLNWDASTRDLPVDSAMVDLAAFYQGEKVHLMLKPAKKDAWSIAIMCSVEIDEGAHQACMTKMGEEQVRLATAAGKDCSSAKSDASRHHGHH